MPTANQIKEHWDNKASTFGTDSRATHEDVFLRQMEIENLAKYLENNKNIVDVGCGNGYSTIELSKKYSEINMVGLDYSEKMIEVANDALKKENTKNVRFQVFDILDDTTDLSEQFDIAISERCLINLSSIEDQVKGLINISNLVKPGGLILLSEETIQAYNNINNLRKKVNLPDMAIQWHNLYLDIDIILNKVSHVLEFVKEDNFSSSYYIGTRFYKALFYESIGKDPGSDLTSIFNQSATLVPPLGDFGLLKIIVLKKVNK